MKKLLFFLLHITLAQSIYSQNPPVKKWDKTLGGTQSDELFCLSETKDRGFIIGGTSYSPIGADKTQSNWDTSLQTADYWIVKTDADGNKQWDRRFGGTGEEIMMAVQQTSDGGYILGGTSYSPISGDKSQNNWGGADFWIVKTDSFGVKQWDRVYGGTGDDYFQSFQQTSDGGYIIGGYSGSSQGGDISESCRGEDDYWIIKIDTQGNKQWDARYGTFSEDVLGALIQTYDGGYIIGGYTGGGISDDKTQPLKGIVDYWVVKTDSIGNKLWDKDFGGLVDNELYTLAQTKDNGYIYAGVSYGADSGGDKSQNKEGYWIVKSDSLGNKEWDKTFSDGFLVSVFATSDGGFLLGGMTSYDATIDKTEHNLGKTQCWIVKTDSVGNKQWDRTIFTYDSLISYGTGIFGGYSIQTKDGGYLIGTPSNAGIGGYKTQAPKGYLDYFIVKMTDSFPTGIPEPEGSMHLLVYPNPTSSDLYINIQKDNLTEASFTLSNTSGQYIYQSTADHLAHSYTKILDLSQLPTGVYMLDVVVDGERIVKKVVKE